eukprot:7391816-Prymnesium_polylepis.2
MYTHARSMTTWRQQPLVVGLIPAIASRTRSRFVLTCSSPRMKASRNAATRLRGDQNKRWLRAAESVSVSNANSKLCCTTS